jgi:hypothetical protein
VAHDAEVAAIGEQMQSFRRTCGACQGEHGGKEGSAAHGEQMGPQRAYARPHAALQHRPLHVAIDKRAAAPYLCGRPAPHGAR